MRAIIIAAGEEQNEREQQLVRDGDLLIGADGGAARALAWGLVPHLVIGDMDSLSIEARRALEAGGCRFVIHPRAKDETDLELALTHAAEQGAQEILVLGALGGRLDHTLANVLLLTLPELAGLSVRIVQDKTEAMVVRAGETALVEGEVGDLVSLLPLGRVQGIRTEGLAWSLHGDALELGYTRGVSNEMISPVAQIAVKSGCLLVVHTALPEGVD